MGHSPWMPKTAAGLLMFEKGVRTKGRSAQQNGRARREMRAKMASDGTRLFFRAELVGYRIRKIEEGDREAVGDVFVPSIAIPEFMERFRTSLGDALRSQPRTSVRFVGRQYQNVWHDSLHLQERRTSCSHQRVTDFAPHCQPHQCWSACVG
jgi:hypothetical protein